MMMHTHSVEVARLCSPERRGCSGFRSARYEVPAPEPSRSRHDRGAADRLTTPRPRPAYPFNITPTNALTQPRC